MTSPAATAEPETPPEPGTPRPGWMPGLDGLRAIAVVAVVAFHARVPSARGGFLGVSLFLTLSGFLITNRALAAHRRGEVFRPWRFTLHRLRRLAPAAAATVALTVLVIAFAGSADQRATIRTDALWALSYAQNWRAAFSGTSYAASFRAPSAFEHYWSLAVEEQFYLVFPLLMLAVIRWGRDRMLIVVGALGLISIGLALGSGWSSGRLYYGTDTRAWELLAGVGLALAGVRIAPRLLTRPTVTAWVRRAMLTVLAIGFMTIEVSGRWVGSGWLVAGPLVAVPLIAAVAVHPGRALTWAPLRRLGELAYGIYLVHWPLQLAADRIAPGASAWLVAPAVLALSAALAAASLRWLENPVRFGRRPRVWAPRVIGVTVAVTVALVVVPVPSSNELVALPDAEPGTAIAVPTVPAPVPPATAPGTTSEATGGSPAPSTPAPSAPAPSTPAPSTPAPTTGAQPGEPAGQVRMAMVGDSTAFTLLLPGISIAGDAGPNMRPEVRTYPSGTLVPVGADVRLGCGIARHDALPERCAGRWGEWDQLIRTTGPDIVVFLPGQWELIDMSVQGRGRSVEDPVVAEFVRREYVESMRALSASGARIVALTAGPFLPSMCAVQRFLGGTDCDPDQRNRRIEIVNNLIRGAAAELGGRAGVVELGEWLRTADADGTLRPDGAHWSKDGAEATWAWLGPKLVAAATAG